MVLLHAPDLSRVVVTIGCQRSNARRLRATDQDIVVRERSVCGLCNGLCYEWLFSDVTLILPSAQPEERHSPPAVRQLEV